MSLTFWLQFVLVCVIGAMSPGPSVALIIRNSVTFSRTAGILSAIGHALGIGIYASLAILGLHFILITNHFIFNSIQIIIYGERRKQARHYYYDWENDFKFKLSSLDMFDILVGILFWWIFIPIAINSLFTKTNMRYENDWDKINKK